MLQDARQYWRSEQGDVKKTNTKKAPPGIYRAAQSRFSVR